MSRCHYDASRDLDAAVGVLLYAVTTLLAIVIGGGLLLVGVPWWLAVPIGIAVPFGGLRLFLYVGRGIKF